MGGNAAPSCRRGVNVGWFLNPDAFGGDKKIWLPRGSWENAKEGGAAEPDALLEPLPSSKDKSAKERSRWDFSEVAGLNIDARKKELLT